jgi:hypothetical protein
MKLFEAVEYKLEPEYQDKSFDNNTNSNIMRVKSNVSNKINSFGQGNPTSLGGNIKEFEMADKLENMIKNTLSKNIRFN